MKYSTGSFNKQHLFFSGMQSKVEEVLEGLGVLNMIRPGHRFILSFDALQHAAYEAGSSHSEIVPKDIN